MSQDDDDDVPLVAAFTGIVTNNNQCGGHGGDDGDDDDDNKPLLWCAAPDITSSRTSLGCDAAAGTQPSVQQQPTSKAAKKPRAKRAPKKTAAVPNPEQQEPQHQQQQQQQGQNIEDVPLQQALSSSPMMSLPTIMMAVAADASPAAAAATAPSGVVADAADTVGVENEHDDANHTTDVSAAVVVSTPAPSVVAVKAAPAPKKTSSKATTAATATASTAAPKKDKKISDEASIQAMVSDWFAREIRPTSTQGIVDALGSKVSKINAQKALDALLADQKIAKKDFKKFVVYFPIVEPLSSSAAASADNKDAVAETKTEQEKEEEAAHLEQLKNRIAALSAEIAAVEGSIRSQKQLLQARLAEAPIQNLERDYQVLHQDVTKLTENLQELEQEEKEKENARNNSSSGAGGGGGGGNQQHQTKSGSKLVQQQNAFDVQFPSVQDKVCECQRLRQLVRERKILTHDIVDTVCGERRPRDVFAELGLQSEDEMQQSMSDSDWQLAHFVFSLEPSQQQQQQQMHAGR